MRPRALADFRLMYNSIFRAPLDRQIAGLFAFENTPGIDTRHVVSVGNAAAIAHEATGDDKLSIFKNCRHCMTDSQCGKLLLSGDKKRTAADHKSTRS